MATKFKANDTAKRQFNWNKKAATFQAQLNNVNQETPYGKSVFKPITNAKGKVTGFTQKIKPTGTQKALIGQEEALAGDTLGAQSKLTGQIGAMQPFSLSGLPTVDKVDFSSLGAMPEADDAARQRVEDALYTRATSRLDPEWNKRQTDLETQLVNAGHARGSPGWTQAMDDFNRQRTDAYDTARTGAVATGGEEQSRLFGLGLTGRQQGMSEILSKFGADSGFRNQIMSELLAERNQPFNELSVLRNGAGGSTMPQYSGPSASSVGAADYSTPAMYADKQQQNSSNATTSALFNLAGKAIPMLFGGA